MRVPCKPALKPTRHRTAETSQQVSLSRNCLELVPNLAGFPVPTKQEPLVPLFDVHFSRGIYKPEPIGVINRLNNPAEIQRPQPQRPHLDRNNFSNPNRCSGIRNSRPAKIELRPLCECPLRSRKHALTDSKT